MDEECNILMRRLEDIAAKAAEAMDRDQTDEGGLYMDIVAIQGLAEEAYTSAKAVVDALRGMFAAMDTLREAVR